MSALSDPACATCDQYAQSIEIHGPAQLRRIIGKLQTAVAELRLRPIDSQEALADLPNFSSLDLSKTLPDILAYRLECTACRRAFEMHCECYHGIGGQWRPI